MRRTPCRPRSSSASRQGRVPIDYLRELACVSLIIVVVLLFQQPFRHAAKPVADHAHHDHPVYAMALTHGDRHLWVSRESYGLSQIDLATGTECERTKLLFAEASFASHGGSEHPLTFRFGFDRTVALLRGNEVVHSEVVPDELWAIAESDVSADGSTALMATAQGLMKVWKAQPDGTFAGRVYRWNEGVHFAVLSDDGQQVVIVNARQIVCISLPGGEELTRWTHWDETTKNALRTGRADAVALSGDGALLAVGYSDGLVRLWNCQDRQLVWQRRVDAYKISALAFSTSGLLATAGFDNAVRVWDWRTDTLLWERTEHERAIRTLAFTSDETRLYTGGLDGRVQEYDAQSGTLRRPLP